MRSRILPAVGISALALVAAAAFAPMASASHGAWAAHKTPPGALVHTTCYAQLDNDNGVGISSQNFEPANDAYDDQGADDFKLAASCHVKLVTTAGFFSGAGSADSFNVTFYKNASGTPGAVIKSRSNRPYTDASGTGNVTVKLGRKGPKLGAHRYWVSVQANMNFGTEGQWGWLTNNTVRGAGSVWQQPGNGAGTGCTTYTTTTTCLAAGEGGDFAFAVGN
jgi:hypothetical protein